ncbi:cytosine permease [Actinoallomurus sp. NPDC050550]|uniref:purine-cytosine permease family protein n=1 Tax=Actinoallomurus sp. NPDC050550 TaxID=3154937 RepID=UPI00340330C9
MKPAAYLDESAAAEDYSLHRVPVSARYSWWSVATQRFGQLSALSQFLLGVTLGLGMTFWRAVLAIALGSVLLEIVSIFVGIAGTREGLSTSVLARWTGFGNKGSAIVGLTIAVSLIGWFGVQNAVFAEGLHSLLGGPSVEAWSLIGGLGVTAIVIFGFNGMAWAAYVTVPAFVALAVWAVGRQLVRFSLHDLIWSQPVGRPLSLAAGATLVAGGFIVGAVMTPDMTRYNRTVGDVVRQTLVGITVGEFFIGLIGVLLAHALHTVDVVAIITTTSGLWGTVVLTASVLKINDWNLYSSTLGLVNVIDVLAGRCVSRRLLTVLIGVLGSALSATGLLHHFIGFLTILGILIPPVAGIMIAEYYVVRTWRAELDSSRSRGRLPADAPEWVPASLISWAGAGAAGYFIHVGIPALNALVVAFAGHIALSRMGRTLPRARVREARDASSRR